MLLGSLNLFWPSSYLTHINLMTKYINKWPSHMTYLTRLLPQTPPPKEFKFVNKNTFIKYRLSSLQSFPTYYMG